METVDVYILKSKLAEYSKHKSVCLPGRGAAFFENCGSGKYEYRGIYFHDNYWKDGKVELMANAIRTLYYETDVGLVRRPGRGENMKAHGLRWSLQQPLKGMQIGRHSKARVLYRGSEAVRLY